MTASGDDQLCADRAKTFPVNAPLNDLFVDHRQPASDAYRRAELRLRRRIELQYQTITSDSTVGPLRLRFTRIADPNLVLDEVAAEEDRREKTTGIRHAEPLHLPYWAELWDSAAGLGQYMVGHRRELTDRRVAEDPAASRRREIAARQMLNKRLPMESTRVLDLGCGMGLSGTVAAALGMEVLFADLEAPALLFARLNSLRYADRVRTRKLNWQTDRLGEKFDLILGADILYDKTQWYFLEPFWREHLADGGQILLGEPGRVTGDQFYLWIKQRGWDLEQFAEKVPLREKAIRIFQLRLPAGK